MVSNLTSKFKILGLFILLVIVALFPIIVTNYSNIKRLDILNTSEFAADKESVLSYDEVTDDVIERLEIISDAKTKKTGIITEQSDNFSSQEYREEVIANIASELTIMQNYKVIPKFDILSENEIRIIRKIDFADKMLPNRRVSVLEVQVSYPTFGYAAYMDLETNKIYQFTFIIGKENTELDFDESSFNNFMSYIGIPVQQVEDAGKLKEPTGLFKVYNSKNGNIVATWEYIKDKAYLGVSLKYDQVVRNDSILTQN